jgi:hypothetical protein
MYVHTAFVDIIWLYRCQQVKYQCSAKNKRRFKHDPMSNRYLCMGGACYVYMGVRCTPIILRKKFTVYNTRVSENTPITFLHALLLFYSCRPIVGTWLHHHNSVHFICKIMDEVIACIKNEIIDLLLISLSQVTYFHNTFLYVNRNYY